MNAIRYAYLPPSRKVKMSDCHIWLGVARSKKRGRVMLRRLGVGALFINCASCNRVRTVSGLASKKKSRRSHWEMRFTPKEGFSFLISRIRSVTAGLSLARSGCGPAG